MLRPSKRRKSRSKVATGVAMTSAVAAIQASVTSLPLTWSRRHMLANVANVESEIHPGL